MVKIKKLEMVGTKCHYKIKYCDPSPVIADLRLEDNDKNDILLTSALERLPDGTKVKVTIEVLKE